jgi:hypothetical protein
MARIRYMGLGTRCYIETSLTVHTVVIVLCARMCLVWKMKRQKKQWIFCELAGVALCSRVALLWVVTSKAKGGLISKRFFTLSQISKKPMTNHDPEHYPCLKRRCSGCRVLAPFFGDLTQSEMLSEIKLPQMLKRGKLSLAEATAIILEVLGVS